jgi:hypothetical protein
LQQHFQQQHPTPSSSAIKTTPPPTAIPMMAVLDSITLLTVAMTLEAADAVLLGPVEVALVWAMVFVAAAPWPVAVKGRKVTGTWGSWWRGR